MSETRRTVIETLRKLRDFGHVECESDRFDLQALAHHIETAKPGDPCPMCEHDSACPLREAPEASAERATDGQTLAVSAEPPSPAPAPPPPPPPSKGRGQHETVVEHAQLMSGGSMQVRPNDPEIDRIYPLDQWIRAHTRFGGRVYRRTVIVVEDWTEVSSPETPETST